VRPIVSTEPSWKEAARAQVVGLAARVVAEAAVVDSAVKPPVEALAVKEEAETLVEEAEAAAAVMEAGMSGLAVETAEMVRRAPRRPRPR